MFHSINRFAWLAFRALKANQQSSRGRIRPHMLILKVRVQLFIFQPSMDEVGASNSLRTILVQATHTPCVK
jgi:hypothetical protein